MVIHLVQRKFRSAMNSIVSRLISKVNVSTNTEKSDSHKNHRNFQVQCNSVKMSIKELLGKLEELLDYVVQLEYRATLTKNVLDLPGF